MSKTLVRSKKVIPSYGWYEEKMSTLFKCQLCQNTTLTMMIILPCTLPPDRARRLSSVDYARAIKVERMLVNHGANLIAHNKAMEGAMDGVYSARVTGGDGGVVATIPPGCV